MNYAKYYDLESYLFSDVHKFFHDNYYLSAADFFCIIIWKANRAKSKIAKKIHRIGKKKYKNLDEIVKQITNALYKAGSHEKRMGVLIGEWKFRLPIASAILTVLYPNNFTVYDVRVCNYLKNENFHGLRNRRWSESLWSDYQAFIQAVKSDDNTPRGLTLRQKDRWIWGKSFFEDLLNDIDNNFALRGKK
ncbi:MAG: hypothetical protein HYS17_11165 [Micavibrio aeruginosavorus]|uniref:Uncharacterized protein n=1 Tax=Micavibrio aeruginosavorus TaxID=349221 RepID=A0A7T5UI12_9BACT|nr:MAG: hypothetical protein HYS17_11165 [Micavibrio aeruginosavorus]